MLPGKLNLSWLHNPSTSVLLFYFHISPLQPQFSTCQRPDHDMEHSSDKNYIWQRCVARSPPESSAEMLLQPGNIKLAKANLFTETWSFPTRFCWENLRDLEWAPYPNCREKQLGWTSSLAYLVHLSESSIHYQVEQDCHEKFLLPESG